MIEIWDKKEAINGVSAEYFMKDNPLTIGEVLLVRDDNTEVIAQVLNVNVLRSNLNLSADLTALEVGAAYLKSLEGAPAPVPDATIQRMNDLEAAVVELASLVGGNA